MNPIKIGRTRSCFFTKTQKNKIDTGIQIFLSSLKHKYFEQEILQFNWKNHQNKRFNRFYHASGLSNRQVLERMQNFQVHLEEIGFNPQLVVLPYSSQNEIKQYRSINNPIIWVSLNCIHNDWYTSIHIASAICHDLAFQMGLDGYGSQMSKLEYKAYSAPEFMGQLILKTASHWKDSISEVAQAIELIDALQYNYFPASTIIGGIYPKTIQHNQINFEKLISSLLIEQETLFSLQDKLTISETKRLVCIEEVLLKLNKLRKELIDCSLDGSDLDHRNTPTNMGSRRSN